MKAKLLKILKIIISDVRQASVPAILLWLVGGVGGLLSVYTMVVNGITQTINKPIPVWVAIVAVLLIALYLYQNNLKILKKYNELSQSSRSPTKEKLEFIFHNNLIWLSNDKAPFCPVCYEVNEKPIHMLLKQASNNYEEWNYYECHTCEHRSDFSSHPSDVQF